MIGGYRLRRRITRRTLPLLRWSRAVSNRLAHTWRRSLQLRVVVSTLSLSLIVMLVLGVVLTSQITERLLEVKINAATEEVERSRALVEGQLAGADDSGSLQVRLDGAVAALTNRGSDAGEDTGVAGTFDPALIVPGDGPRAPTSSGPADQIPENLRAFVQKGQIAYQFATVSDPDGYSGPALIVGTPTASDISTLELYLVFPLAGEENTLSLVRGTLLVGAGVLLVLLAAISMIVARQVVLPIRSASRIAVRFADGRLKERMPVRGEDDMARLAMSFNEMAESLSRQITQLEEFGNLQKRFTSDVSHELRTPLTTVRMAADLIHDGSDELDPSLKRASELLVTELDRFESLLGDLLEISRHDAGVAELAAEQLDLRMCARAAVSTVRHLARESGTELIVDLPGEPVDAEVDPRRVERIL
ncbi:MtrAB system histidine kinase MtrB, partial [Rhodococcus ruber]|uniref:MtrAB system histidine kinase MtrB n=2 Tax=Nocardiaceae TaxID=85025 RepID=UPI0024B79633